MASSSSSPTESNVFASAYTSTSTFDENKYVRDVYNEIGHHFSQTRAYQWDWITKFIQQFPKDALIYDIGCGSGRNMDPARNFIGVDNSDAFLDICREKGHEVVKADMTCLPFANETANAIISIASFHHLATEERRIEALAEMARVLKSNTCNGVGKLLLSVWSKEQPKKTRRTFEYGDNIVTWNKHGTIYERYYYIFELDEIKKLFDHVGLKIISHDWECGNEVFVLECTK
jgi:SAM-dependent methyltransferase